MEPYVPRLNFVYPDKPDEHIVDIKNARATSIVLDENYPFLNRSFKFSFMRNLMHLGIFTLVFFLSPVRFGLKIEGRNILRAYRALFKNGAMTVSNHMHRWDFLFILQAVRYRTMYFPLWKEHLNGSDEGFVRYAGGIPIPEEISAIKCFNRAFDQIHASKKWIHAFPESSRFDYFQPIRPFKKGVFTMAYRYQLPVIPLAFSYRKPHFPFTVVNLFRSMTKNQKLPMITVRIGEPLLFDATLSRKEAVQKMRKDCHDAIVRLAGIRDNPYPAEGD